MKTCKVVISIGEVTSLLYANTGKSSIQIINYRELTTCDYFKDGQVNDDVNLAKAIAKDIEEHRKNNKVEITSATVIFPASYYDEVYVPVPTLNSKGRKVNLDTHFKRDYFKQIGVDPKAETIDWTQLGTINTIDNEGKTIEQALCLISRLSRKRSDLVLKSLQHAKIPVNNVVSPAFCAGNVVATQSKVIDDYGKLIVLMGDTKTELIIAKNGIPVSLNTLNYGFSDIEQAISKGFDLDAKMSFLILSRLGCDHSLKMNEWFVNSSMDKNYHIDETDTQDNLGSADNSDSSQSFSMQDYNAPEESSLSMQMPESSDTGLETKMHIADDTEEDSSETVENDSYSIEDEIGISREDLDKEEENGLVFYKQKEQIALEEAERKAERLAAIEKRKAEEKEAMNIELASDSDSDSDSDEVVISLGDSEEEEEENSEESEELTISLGDSEEEEEEDSEEPTISLGDSEETEEPTISLEESAEPEETEEPAISLEESAESEEQTISLGETEDQAEPTVSSANQEETEEPAISLEESAESEESTVSSANQEDEMLVNVKESLMEQVKVESTNEIIKETTKDSASTIAEQIRNLGYFQYQTPNGAMQKIPKVNKRDSITLRTDGPTSQIKESVYGLDSNKEYANKLTVDSVEEVIKILVENKIDLSYLSGKLISELSPVFKAIDNFLEEFRVNQEITVDRVSVIAPGFKNLEDVTATNLDLQATKLAVPVKQTTNYGKVLVTNYGIGIPSTGFVALGALLGEMKVGDLNE